MLKFLLDQESAAVLFLESKMSDKLSIFRNAIGVLYLDRLLFKKKQISVVDYSENV